MATKKPAKVLLMDGHSLAFRAFYALPPDLRTTSGQQTNAVYGFTSMLIKALQDFKTEHLAVVFDSGKPIERMAIRPEYKAQREAPPDEFRQQLGLIREVLDVLKVRTFEAPNIEADDIIALLAKKLAEEGHEVILVTADRDFFQVVGPRIKLMMNRRGISDTVVYDEAGVRQRFGFGPDRYLEYAALRGDPSDNIEGVVGVGEKTAAKLVIEHGSLEKVFENLDALTPRIRTNLEQARERLLINREFFRFRSADELSAQGVDLPEIEAEMMKIGEWDPVAVRKLFDALEFKTLYERLTEDRPSAAIPDAGFDMNTIEVESAMELESIAAVLAGADEVALTLGGKGHLDPPEWISLLLPDDSSGVRSSALIRVSGSIEGEVWKALGEVLESSRIVTHGSKEVVLRLAAAGIEGTTVSMDTEIAAYLVDPARGSYGLDELAVQYLQKQLRVDRPSDEAPPAQQELTLDIKEEENDRQYGLEALAVQQLSSVLEKELRERGGWDLFVELELPLATVLAKMERAGIKIDIAYLDEMASAMSSELKSIEKEIYAHSGEPFNINSPPQLRRVLYEELQLKPSKRTKTGYSTDASVLETLRDQHPIVDAILRYRERSKLKSTYIDALPPLVDPRTGRLHCRFNQTVASTGRLSSDSPNLQNIPIRTEEGRHIRRAFIPEDGYVLLVADYSQIELRILAHLSQDPELVGAFTRGEDIHRKSIAKALGIDEAEVTPQLRSIGKMVSYGVTYGMGPFGLSQRLRIPVDQARTYIEGFFGLYPKVREYLDSVVERATDDGFTTTLLGRRRYLPELKARNPRVRSLGERMALNAPIQGSAADVMKLAMVRADEVLAGTDARAVLTVHDELVFEVPESEVGSIGKKIRRAMESVVDLTVPLEVDLAHGPNWAEAKV